MHEGMDFRSPFMRNLHANRFLFAGLQACAPQHGLFLANNLEWCRWRPPTKKRYLEKPMTAG